MSVRELFVARGADALLRGCDHDGSYYTYLLTYVFDVVLHFAHDKIGGMHSPVDAARCLR